MPDEALEEQGEIEASATPADNVDATDTATSSGEGEHTEPKTEEPQTMADAINAALEAAPDGEAPKSDTTDEDAEEPEAALSGSEVDGEGDEASKAEKSEVEANDDMPDDPTDDELKAMKPKAQKRIAKLLSQRREARAEVSALRGDADNFRQVQTFMSENNLVDAEVANLFKAGAALKSGTPEGYKSFLELATPMVQQALEATGQAVPKDLMEQVDVGEMTEAAAYEVGKSRHAATRAEAQAEQVRSQAQQTQRNQAQANIAQAVNAWSQRTATTDPDFSRKADAMKRVSQALVAERGLPPSPDVAVQMAQAAYEEVTTMMRASNPPRATRQQPTASASSTRNGVRAAPQSLADIVAQGLSS